jgi:hypothetical protein
MKKKIALVYGADGDDYAKYCVYLIPQEKYSDKLLESLNNKVSDRGVWLEKLPLTEVVDFEALEEDIETDLA